jgi:hypothetical protein
MKNMKNLDLDIKIETIQSLKNESDLAGWSIKC